MTAQSPPTFRIVLALGGAYVLSQFLRTSVAVLAPELSTELGLSADELGLLTGAYFLSFALVQLPIGVALDRIGPRRVVASLMLAAVAGSLLFSMANGLALLVAARVLMGLGCASILMGAYVIYARWYPSERFAYFAGLQMGIGNTGILLATAPLAGLVAWIGWRDSLDVVAVVAALLGLSFYLLIRDNPPMAENPGPRESLGASIAGIRGVFADRRIWPLFPLLFVGYSAVASISTLWGGPYFAEVHGLDMIGRGNRLLLMAMGSILGGLSFAPMERLFNTRKHIVLAGAIVTIIDFLALGLIDAPPLWLVTAEFVLLAWLAGYMTVLLAHVRSLFSGHILGRGMTGANMINMGGVAVMQVITGYIISGYGKAGRGGEEAYQAVFLFLAVSLTLAALVYVLASDRPPRPGRSKPGD